MGVPKFRNSKKNPPESPESQNRKQKWVSLACSSTSPLVAIGSAASSWSSAPTSCPKPRRTSALSAPARRDSATRGPSSTESSQFFLCTAKTSWLDGKHVVFGQVVEGMDVVKKIESYGSQSGKCSQKVTVVDCGQL